MNKRHRLWVYSGVIALLAISGVWYFARSSEPSWHGRKLSAYLRQMRPYHGGTVAEQREAELALRNLGQQSIPFLIAWSDSKDNPVQRICYEMLPRRQQIQLNPEWAYDRQWMAANGFTVLGTNANIAVPKLARLLGDGRKGRAAAAALSGIGVAAFPALTNLLFQPRTAPDAAFAVTRFEDAAIPVLWQAAFSTNPVVRVAALAGIHLCVFDSYNWSNPDWVTRASSTSMKFDSSRVAMGFAVYQGRENALLAQMIAKCESNTNAAVIAAARTARNRLGL